jgi:hypothetical protein
VTPRDYGAGFWALRQCGPERERERARERAREEKKDTDSCGNYRPVCCISKSKVNKDSFLGWETPPAMKKKVRKFFTVPLFYLDLEVVFHMNDKNAFNGFIALFFFAEAVIPTHYSTSLC